jgi:hypothetical protein
MSTHYLELGTEAWVRAMFVHCLAQKLEWESSVFVCCRWCMVIRGDKSGMQQNFSHNLHNKTCTTTCMTTCTTTFIIQLAAHMMEVLCVCQFVYLLLQQIKGNLESTHLKLGTTGTTISSPIMLSSEHKSGVFNSYWRMHPMGKKTKPWTHPRKHPNNSQKGSVVAFGMTKKTGFLASQDTDLINHKTPDCTLSKTE